MRFITEFELLSDFEIKNYKGLRSWGTAQSLGTDIAKAFGWKERGETTHHGRVAERHTLEIEAFPMDKWVEFKKRLFVHLGATGLYEPIFKDLISELESFGNSAGEAKNGGGQ